MLWFCVKVIITAIVIVAVSEIGKTNTFLGALLASIPLVSTLGMLWMHIEGTEASRIMGHATGVFWLVLPSLPMFLLLPWMMNKGAHFYTSLAVSLGLTIVLYFATAAILKRWGILI